MGVVTSALGQLPAEDRIASGSLWSGGNFEEKSTYLSKGTSTHTRSTHRSIGRTRHSRGMSDALACDLHGATAGAHALRRGPPYPSVPRARRPRTGREDPGAAPARASARVRMRKRQGTRARTNIRMHSCSREVGGGEVCTARLSSAKRLVSGTCMLAAFRIPEGSAVVQPRQPHDLLAKE